MNINKIENGITANKNRKIRKYYRIALGKEGIHSCCKYHKFIYENQQKRYISFRFKYNNTNVRKQSKQIKMIHIYRITVLLILKRLVR